MFCSKKETPIYRQDAGADKCQLNEMAGVIDWCCFISMKERNKKYTFIALLNHKYMYI